MRTENIKNAHWFQIAFFKFLYNEKKAQYLDDTFKEFLDDILQDPEDRKRLQEHMTAHVPGINWVD